MCIVASPGTIVDFNGRLRLHRREMWSGGSGGRPRFAAQHCRHQAGSRITNEPVADKDRAFDRYTGSDCLSPELNRLSKANKNIWTFRCCCKPPPFG